MLTALRFWRQGLIAALVLACILFRADARHWHKQSDHNAALHHAEELAHKQTVANYRAAAEAARKADAENKARVEAQQNNVSREVSDDYREKLADLRRRYDALRLRLAAPANPGSAGAAPVPGLPDPACRADEGACQNGLPAEDALIASEQALQLQALIDWVKRQTGVVR